MCSWIWDFDGIDFMKEEKEFLESLRQKKKEENNNPKNIENIMDKNKTEIKNIVDFDKK